MTYGIYNIYILYIYDIYIIYIYIFSFYFLRKVKKMEMIYSDNKKYSVLCFSTTRIQIKAQI